jgi:large subunit ribosomal protein L28
MAGKCDICGKSVGTGHLVSHSNIKTKRTFLPNLQRVRAVIDGRTKRITVCTGCLRSGRVKRPSRVKEAL